MLHGFGTADGTQLFSDRFPKAQASGFYQTANELTISTIGLGTYLGEEDRKTDEAYEAAAIEALRGASICSTLRSTTAINDPNAPWARPFEGF